MDYSFISFLFLIKEKIIIINSVIVLKFFFFFLMEKRKTEKEMLVYACSPRVRKVVRVGQGWTGWDREEAPWLA